MRKRGSARLELPVCDGTVTAAVLADAVAANYMWPMLARLLAPIYSSLRIVRRNNRTVITAGEVCLTTDPGERECSREELHDQVGWTVFLQELFGRPDITDAGFYDESWADPHRARGHAGSTTASGSASRRPPASRHSTARLRACW